MIVKQHVGRYLSNEPLNTSSLKLHAFGCGGWRFKLHCSYISVAIIMSRLRNSVCRLCKQCGTQPARSIVFLKLGGGYTVTRPKTLDKQKFILLFLQFLTCSKKVGDGGNFRDLLMYKKVPPPSGPNDATCLPSCIISLNGGCFQRLLHDKNKDKN